MPCCGVGPGSSSCSGGGLQHCSAVGGPPWSGGQSCGPGSPACTCRAGQNFVCRQSLACSRSESLCVDSLWPRPGPAGRPQRRFAHSLLKTCPPQPKPIAAASMQAPRPIARLCHTLLTTRAASDYPLQSVHAAVTACRPSQPWPACLPQVQASSTPCTPAVVGSTWCRPCFCSHLKEKALMPRCAC